MSINAGVVVVNQFCNSASKLFTGYINYMDREEAIRSENTVKYNLYNDYMGNPEKTSGLFTNMKKSLSDQDISTLKQRFETAQNNGSLMWQTVISFDNQWLEEFGLYSSETKTLNEKKLKELATNGINRMLRNENLEHAVWSGAIHYNTDNIHIHVATVEEYPKRETRMYTQYDYSLNDKNRLIADGIILNLDGTPLIKEEAKGKFKLKSIELCKQSITNEIIKEKDLNIQINQVIRERINGSFRTKLLQDKELLSKMKQLYETLPDCNRSLWNYNNSIMKSYQPKIDDISRSYIENYHSEDFKQLLSMLDKQSNLYRTAYGNSSSDFKETKLKDLYTRMGNSFLKAIKVLDKELAADQKFPLEPTYFEESLSLGNENTYYPLGIIYSNPKDKLYDIKKGIYYLKMASDKNNPYASFKLGKIYEQIGEQEQSHINYCKSLKEFLALEKKEPKTPNLKQQLGIMYYRGLGTDIDFKKASQYFEESLNQGNSSAKYYLGMIYTTSGSPCYDIKKGIMLLEESRSDGNHYATCRLGDLYNFQLNDKTKALSYYKEASDNGSMYAQNQLLKMTFSNMNQNIRKNFHFEKALQYLKQSLKKDYESWKNILEHDRELQNALHQSDSNYDF